MYGQYKIAKEWNVKGGLDFAHHSNGAMARPNKGANYLGPFLGLVYEPQQATSHIAKRNTNETKPFQKYWFTEFTLGLGGKTLLEEWLQTQFNTPQGQPDYRKEHFTYYGAYGLEYPYHEQVGVFYSFPKLKRLTLGFSVNSHATKADFTELQISMPVRL